MNIDKVERHILEDAARNLGWQQKDFRDDYDPNDDPIEPYLERLAKMNPRQIFGLYCNWHGLIGWGHSLFDVVQDLEKAKEQ